MKSIYYLQKHEVKLGDVIEYNGIKTVVTEKLIELNPELFIVKDPTQELLNKARGITMYTPEDGWCEIIPFKFTTEDGVNIYGDMKTYAVSKGDLDIDNPEIYGGTSTSLKYFYHKENALAYIKKHKEKTLEDYENMLLRTNIDSINAREGCSFYHTLKKKEPKFYYTKILQLIADDLNDVRYIHERSQASFYINKEGRVTLHIGDDEGDVYFKSKELAEKARVILGDK